MRTARTECLDWLLILGQRQLDRVLRVYVDHYNTERPHRALGRQPPIAIQPPPPPPPQATIQRRDRLGGLLHECHLAAARRTEYWHPSRPSIRDEHYPPRPPGALERRPKAGTLEEQAFLQIAPGAAEWLTQAAAPGVVRLRRKIAEAVVLAKLHGAGDVDEALAAAAAAGRFGEGDLAAILAHRGATVIDFPTRASEQQSLQRSTRSWEGFGG